MTPARNMWAKATEAIIATNQFMPPTGPPEDKKDLVEANGKVVELRKHMPRRDRSAWCVLYCGGVKKVQDDLRSSCEAWRFLYSEESFAW